MRYYRTSNRRRFNATTPVTKAFAEDAALIKERFAALPTFWDGKTSVLELQVSDNNPDQNDGWVSYFESLCLNALHGEFRHPGDGFGASAFHLKRNVNWDLKAKATNSDSQMVLLNDTRAMRQTIQRHGETGVVLALCNVEYGDTDRTFEQERAQRKGGVSALQNEREPRTSLSRYRITHTTLTQILLLRFTRNDLPKLCRMREGRDADAVLRPHFKYTLNIEKMSNHLIDRIVF